MNADALAKEIGQFISDNSSNRSVMPAISTLKSAQSALNRIGSNASAKPSPGKQAAMRSGSQGSAKFPPAKGAQFGG
jgi:hypothetical protein